VTKDDRLPGYGRLSESPLLKPERENMRWERIIKENMVLVDGEETSYRVKDGKRAVLILLSSAPHAS
jgi:hypothetical protein